MKDIAILIPCYNEEVTIKKVINDFQKELPKASIYVYDNNCSDNTALIAKENGAIVVK
jgi:glycosyltransferase involved in cell wall biosynthesis